MKKVKEVTLSKILGLEAHIEDVKINDNSYHVRIVNAKKCLDVLFSNSEEESIGGKVEYSFYIDREGIRFSRSMYFDNGMNTEELMKVKKPKSSEEKIGDLVWVVYNQVRKNEYYEPLYIKFGSINKKTF